MIREKQPLEDIEDVPTYCAALIRNKWGYLPDDLRDEAHAEAVCITYELHARKWNKTQCSSFKAYLSTYLHLRLIDWWRTHRETSGGIKEADGSYAAPTISLDLGNDAGDDLVTDLGGHSHTAPCGLLFDLELAA